MQRSLVAAAIGGLLALSAPSFAADSISFAGKTVAMTVGNAAGSGIDMFGRALGHYLTLNLPGHPALAVFNQPGAGGLIAYNNWIKTAKPDGLSVAVGGLTELDPASLPRANAEYDPSTFKYVGGLGAPSQALFINKAAAARLRDKSTEPVVMGAVGAAFRGGYFQALWGVAFLGWNQRWVNGYRDTYELRQALLRGEADMSTFGNVKDIEILLEGGGFSVISQSGTLKDGRYEPRPGLAEAPIFSDLVKNHIEDPLARRAFDYGENISQVGRWLALPPNTPEPIVSAYLAAYEAAIHDPEYIAAIGRTDPGSPSVNHSDLERLARDLSKVSPDVIGYMKSELKRQGFTVD